MSARTAKAAPLLTRLEDPGVRRLLETRHHDPFELLGRHVLPDGRVIVRACIPETDSLELIEADVAMRRVGNTDLFEWVGPAGELPVRYQLRRRSKSVVSEQFDPYCFGPQLRDADLASWQRGEHTRAWHFLGARVVDVEGVTGTCFAVWAPEAERVSVIGEFNAWDGRRHPMRVRGGSGVWELFIPGVAAGALYKYELRHRGSGELHTKTDPFARSSELRPATASRVTASPEHAWQDANWLARRASNDWLHRPLSVYELHPGSWRRHADGRPLGYRELADQLAPYVERMGFTHVELLPITEYPFDDSWGYQPTGYFAPTSRYGTPDDLRYLIDRMHAAGIGVILDWVPGHFPRDAHGLARFDGSALFEYADSRKGAHPDWGTLVFNYDRNEVRSFLVSSALYWLEEFHFDGLRVDAVASMLYLDYSRKAGEWAPNIHGGNENLEAIAFLKQLNETTHRECPGTLTFAEESTAWPGVTRPTFMDGLGFSLKWNMGWMHDSLAYMREDPVNRKHHHQRITFGPLYAFAENFILPLSHDEVVHGKGSLLGKQPGDRWQQLANLRLLYAFQWTFPGKKLLFMGQELAQPGEWNHRDALPWQLMDEPGHAGVQRIVADLNTLYQNCSALHQKDFEPAGFHWLRWDDADNSVLSYLRISDDREVVVLLNFTPVARHGYRIGVPRGGYYHEVLNTDSRFYGGGDVGNPLGARTEPLPWMDQAQSLLLTLPPLGAVILEHQPAS